MDNLAIVASLIAMVIGSTFAIWAGLNVMKKTRRSRRKRESQCHPAQAQLAVQRGGMDRRAGACRLLRIFDMLGWSESIYNQNHRAGPGEEAF